MTELSKYPLIYCDVCDKTQPMVPAEMAADHLNDHAAMDLLCGECRLVIATLHARSEPAKPSDYETGFTDALNACSKAVYGADYLRDAQKAINDIQVPHDPVGGGKQP